MVLKEKRNKVARIIREFHDEMGGAILIEDVTERAKEEGVNEETALEAIRELERDGLVSRIDEDTIEFM